jgi:hypothetical protein
LLDDFDAERVVLFIGSGVSRNSFGADGITRPKTWAAFLHAAATARGILPRVQAYLDSHDYLTALDILRMGMQQQEYAALIRNEYQRPGYSHAPIHEAINRLDCKIVLTPNFDKIYETYVAQVSRGTIVTKEYHFPQLAEYVRGDTHVVIKIHGSVDDHRKMIFGRKDYARARVENSLFYDILRALILTHTFLFVGCGIDDPDIRLVLEDINFGAGGSRCHYFTAASGAVNQDMKNVLRDTMNLEILEYDNTAGDHLNLTRSLEDLVATLSGAAPTLTPSGVTAP